MKLYVGILTIYKSCTIIGNSLPYHFFNNSSTSWMHGFVLRVIQVNPSKSHVDLP